MSDKNDYKSYEIKVYIHSRKHVVKHLLTQFSVPPMMVEDEVQINKTGNTIEIVFENKDE